MNCDMHKYNDLFSHIILLQNKINIFNDLIMYLAIYLPKNIGILFEKENAFRTYIYCA